MRAKDVNKAKFSFQVECVEMCACEGRRMVGGCEGVVGGSSIFNHQVCVCVLFFIFLKLHLSLVLFDVAENGAEPPLKL